MNFMFRNSLISDLLNRGFLYQFTNIEGIDNLFNADAPVTFYVGFDATAKSLHIGHLLWIILVNKLQKAGHEPIILVGGATSKIGDPTWKDKQRSMLDYSDILNNIDCIMRKLRKFFNFSDLGCGAQLVNNDDWLSKITYIDFLRNFGKHFSVNKMLSMDSVSERLKRHQHLSFLEFNYMLLQAYDFLHLFNNYGCKVQIGGSDQWSNIVSGVDLVRRITAEEVFGVTIPLLTTASGQKMGKTDKGTVWLNESMTNPFDFWQYWRNVDDKDVCKLLLLFTDLDVQTISSYESLIGTQEINDAKIKLADSITSFVHSDSDVNLIKKTVEAVFNSGDPQHGDMEEHEFQDGIHLDKCVFNVGFAPSMTRARTLISSGGIKVDGEVISEFKHKISKTCVICCGKKKFAKIVVI